jgi:hypothetical protein
MPWTRHDLTTFPGVGIQHEVKTGERLFFYDSTKADLQKLASRPIGKQLLKSIESATPTVRSTASCTNHETKSVTFSPGVNVAIIPLDINYIQSGHKSAFVPGGIERTLVRSSMEVHNPADCSFYQNRTATTEAADIQSAEDGRGSVCVVRFSNAYTKTINGSLSPSYIVLGHELIHALHLMTGHRNPDDEEVCTIGLGVYSRDQFTENALRREHGLTLRTS